MTDIEHVRNIPKNDVKPLIAWLARPNGAFTAGNATFEAVEGGSVWVRTKPLGPDPRCTCTTGPQSQGPEEDCPVHGRTTTELWEMLSEANTELTALRGPLARIAIHLGAEQKEFVPLLEQADALAKTAAAKMQELDDARDTQRRAEALAEARRQDEAAENRHRRKAEQLAAERWEKLVAANMELNGYEEVLSSLRMALRDEDRISGGARAHLLGILDGAAPQPRSARYDQCDETCTVDCGHCKGTGAPPKEPAVACSCGGTISPVHDHHVDHTRPVPIEHPALRVQYFDGRQGFYDASDGWKIRDSMIVLGKMALVIPTGSNVMHVSIRRAQW